MAGLADVRAAISGATVGFGGPRIVQAVTGQPPAGHLAVPPVDYAAGRVDAVLSAAEQADWISVALSGAIRPVVQQAWRPPVAAYPTRVIQAGLGPQSWQPAANRPSGLDWAAAV